MKGNIQMNDNISIIGFQYSCKLENLFKKIYPSDCPSQGEIRINFYNTLKNACHRLCAEHQKDKDKIMAFLNKYAFIGEKIDNLIETDGQEIMDTFIEEFSCLLKGCDYDV